MIEKIGKVIKKIALAILIIGVLNIALNGFISFSPFNIVVISVFGLPGIVMVIIIAILLRLQ